MPLRREQVRVDEVLLVAEQAPPYLALGQGDGLSGTAG